MIEHLYTMIIVIRYNFISLQTSSLCCYKPHLPKMYILHILHEHPSGTHLSIFNLKAMRDSDSFISKGIKFNTFEPRQTPV